jgi:hypothetical protein
MVSKTMASKQTLIGGTAVALLLAASITTASAQQRHDMSGGVGGNQTAGANIGANGARGTAQAQLSEGARTTGRVHGSAAMNGSRDSGNAARFSQRADTRGGRDVGMTRDRGNAARFNQRADIRGGRDVGTTYGSRTGRSAGVERDRVYGGQYVRSGYAEGYDGDWRYGGAGYEIAGAGFGYGPDYAYGPYYDYAPGYATSGYYDYAPGFGVGIGFMPGFGVGIGFAPAYGGRF